MSHLFQYFDLVESFHTSLLKPFNIEAELNIEVTFSQSHSLRFDLYVPFNILGHLGTTFHHNLLLLQNTMTLLGDFNTCSTKKELQVMQNFHQELIFPYHG